MTILKTIILGAILGMLVSPSPESTRFFPTHRRRPQGARSPLA